MSFHVQKPRTQNRSENQYFRDFFRHESNKRDGDSKFDILKLYPYGYVRFSKGLLILHPNLEFVGHEIVSFHVHKSRIVVKIDIFGICVCVNPIYVMGTPNLVWLAVVGVCTRI